MSAAVDAEFAAYFAFSSAILAPASCINAGVFGQRFLRRIEEIGQQRKMQAGIAVRQKADLERLDQRLDPGQAGQHGRHHHQRARRPGIPSEKSILGRGRGATSRVASQFTSATASWLVASSASRPSGANAQ